MFASLAAAALATVITVPTSSQSPSGDGGVYMTGVTLGDVDPNGVVPTTNGVPNAGTSNWDVALPLAGLSAGTDYKLTLTFEDVGYTGQCYVDVRMTQIQNGKKVLLRDAGGFSGQCAPNIYLVSTDFGVMPNAPGPVTLTATAHFGKGKSSTKVKLQIQ
jgi:hypothetical protein